MDKTINNNAENISSPYEIMQNEQNNIPTNENFSSNINLNNSDINNNINLSNSYDNNSNNNNFSLKSSEELNQNINNDKTINNNAENTSSPYEIIQNEKLSDNEKNETSFLGLDDEYNNDSLDIMDLNDDKEQDEIKVNNDSSKTNQNSNDALDRIKKLIEELNKEDKKIDVQEFNFDNLVQLVIKIYN